MQNTPIGSVNMSHTILLVQASAKPESRTYSDYETVNDCLEGLHIYSIFNFHIFALVI